MPTSRDEKSKQKKKTICEKSIDLFKTKGYNRTSISDISKATGMSVGSIYHFFGSKEGILRFSIDLADVEVITYDNWDEKIEHPFDTIMSYIQNSADFFEDLGSDFSIHIFPPFDNAYNNPDGSFHNLKGLGVLIEFIRDCQSCGNFTKDVTASFAANYIVAMGRGLIYEWAHFNGPYSLTERGWELMPRVVNTFLPDHLKGKQS